MKNSKLNNQVIVLLRYLYKDVKHYLSFLQGDTVEWLCKISWQLLSWTLFY